MICITGWTNLNLLYLPDSKEITSLERLTLCCPEINQSNKKADGIVIHDFHGLKTMTFHSIADIRLVSVTFCLSPLLFQTMT